MHSIRICFIVYRFPHEHLGGGSSLKMKEWVNLVWPMLSGVIVVSSLLVLLGSGVLSFKLDCSL